MLSAAGWLSTVSESPVTRTFRFAASAACPATEARDARGPLANKFQQGLPQHA